MAQPSEVLKVMEDQHWENHEKLSPASISTLNRLSRNPDDDDRDEEIRGARDSLLQRLDSIVRVPNKGKESERNQQLSKAQTLVTSDIQKEQGESSVKKNMSPQQLDSTSKTTHLQPIRLPIANCYPSIVMGPRWF